MAKYMTCPSCDTSHARVTDRSQYIPTPFDDAVKIEQWQCTNCGALLEKTGKTRPGIFVRGHDWIPPRNRWEP